MVSSGLSGESQSSAAEDDGAVAGGGGPNGPLARGALSPPADAGVRYSAKARSAGRGLPSCSTSSAKLLSTKAPVTAGDAVAATARRKGRGCRLDEPAQATLT